MKASNFRQSMNTCKEKIMPKKAGIDPSLLNKKVPDFLLAIS